MVDRAFSCPEHERTKKMADNKQSIGAHEDKMWEFRTRNFAVSWEVELEHNYQYDGDDEDGEVQRKLNDGDYVAFTSCMSVTYLPTGVVIARDYLGGSVYEWNKVALFRDHIGMNARHHGSYFSDMVREAIAEARRRAKKEEDGSWSVSYGAIPLGKVNVK
jgi:hypothetical protein